jgi:hypothetical protein
MIEHVHDGFSIYHFIETTIPTCVTIILFLAVNRRSARKEQDLRHAENQKKLDALVIRDKYLPAHKHSEKTGPLLAENIQYDPSLQIT